MRSLGLSELSDVLDRMNLGMTAKDPIELFHSAQEVRSLLYLQGSASYMIRDLGIVGQVKPKHTVLDMIEKELRKGKLNKPSAEDKELKDSIEEQLKEQLKKLEWHQDDCSKYFDSGSGSENETAWTNKIVHDIDDCANLLLGQCLLNSKAAPCKPSCFTDVGGVFVHGLECIWGLFVGTTQR